MRAAVLAGLTYFGVVFALAFVMGVARATVIAPRIGETAAVLLEVPVLVAISWGAARRILHDRPFSLAQRALTGGLAFALTMASEAALAGVLRGQSVTGWIGAVATPLGLTGLAGQIAFAAMPMLIGLRQPGLETFAVRRYRRRHDPDE